MWLFEDEPFTEIIEEFNSFVYQIERLNLDEDGDSPRYYIGKKIFIDKRGNESDWNTYYGSSKWLQENIDRFGKHNFKRTILHLCRTRGDSGYLETKEQIDRNVLRKDEDSGYKLYYNKSIFGRYYEEPDTYQKIIPLAFKDIDPCDQSGKKRITNGKKNKILPPTKAATMVKTGRWWYGCSPKHIEVNDGENNLLVETMEEGQELGWIKRRITNGENNKLLPIHQIDHFFEENPGWYFGFSGNKDMVWITNGEEDLKMKIEKWKGEYPDWELGRKVTTNLGKISIFKDGEYQFILEKDLNDYPGWVKRGKTLGTKKYFVNLEGKKTYFKTEDERNIFLSKNPDWVSGAGKPNHNGLPTTKGMVQAKDITKDMKRVYVTEEEYKNDPKLISTNGSGTNQIRVTMNGQTIFEGYRKQFRVKYKNISKSTIDESLRGGGRVIKSHDKNEYSAIYINRDIPAVPEKVDKRAWNKVKKHYFSLYPRRKTLPKQPTYVTDAWLGLVREVDEYLTNMELQKLTKKKVRASSKQL